MTLPSSAVPLGDEIGGDGLLLFQEDSRFATRHQATRPPAHDQHHRDADRQHAVLYWIEARRHDRDQEIQLTEKLKGTDNYDGGDDDAELRSQPAENHDGEDDRRFHEDEGFRAR